MDNPLSQNGQYRFRVIYDGKECETIVATVLNNRIHIDGPKWLGVGILDSYGYYIGYTNLDIGLAFHVMVWDDFTDCYVGSAFYEVGTRDYLKWKLLED